MANKDKALELDTDPSFDDRLSEKSKDFTPIEPENSRHAISGTAEGRMDHASHDIEKGPDERKVSYSNNDPLRDPNLVEWEGDNDPENPMRFSMKRKVWMSCVASFLTFSVSVSSSIFSADTEVTGKLFGVSEEIMVLGVSLYVLGFACGPLVFGPMSEVYGRHKPLMCGFLCFAIFNIPVAVAQNVETVLVCRFLSGCFGGAPVAIAPGILVDLWEPYPRGIATLIWATTVFAGPTFGPVVGEFTVKNEDLGWRWTMWIATIMALVIFAIALPTTCETLAPVVLQRKAARLRFQTKNWALHSKRDEEPVEFKALARKYGIKPLQMLVQEPILLAMTCFMALVYALIYLAFFAFPYSFSVVRGWEIGVSALPFFGLLIGYLIGFLLSYLESTIRFQRLLREKHGEVAPEERLPPMILGSFILIAGMFWFAWTSFPNITWVPQVIASVPIGCGIFMVFMPGQVYLMDVYTANAASALAGNAFVRASLACALPLATNAMYTQLGVQWATSLLGFICIAFAPCPVLFYIFGKKLRGWSKYTLDPN